MSSDELFPRIPIPPDHEASEKREDRPTELVYGFGQSSRPTLMARPATMDPDTFLSQGDVDLEFSFATPDGQGVALLTRTSLSDRNRVALCVALGDVFAMARSVVRLGLDRVSEVRVMSDHGALLGNEARAFLGTLSCPRDPSDEEILRAAQDERDRRQHVEKSAHKMSPESLEMAMSHREIIVRIDFGLGVSRFAHVPRRVVSAAHSRALRAKVEASESARREADRWRHAGDVDHVDAIHGDW